MQFLSPLTLILFSQRKLLHPLSLKLDDILCMLFSASLAFGMLLEHQYLVG